MPGAQAREIDGCIGVRLTGATLERGEAPHPSLIVPAKVFG